VTTYNIENFRADLAEPYAWPGCYPRYFITKDGAALSYNAARNNASLIESSIAEDCNDGWQVVGCDVNWEDSQLYCDHTGELIESAYGEYFA
jgi:hypothetical protein